MVNISKNTILRPGRRVRQTHLMHRTSIANQDAPGAHLILRTHQAHTYHSGRNQTQHLILRTQPDTAPNPQDATRHTTQSSGRNQTQHLILRTPPDAVPTLPEISEISVGSPLYLFLTLVSRVTIYFTSWKSIKFTTNSLLFF